MQEERDLLTTDTPAPYVLRGWTILPEGASEGHSRSRFGNWLASRRGHRGLGVRALAKIAGVSHVTISKIENDLVGASAEMVDKLALALGADRVDAFAAWLEDNTPEGFRVVVVTLPDGTRVPTMIGIGDQYDPRAFAVSVQSTYAALVREHGQAGYGTSTGTSAAAAPAGGPDTPPEKN